MIGSCGAWGWTTVGSGGPYLETNSARGRHNMPPPCDLDLWSFDLLILKVVSESHVTWATSVPILVFLGLSDLDLGPMYATDRRQTSDSIIA